VTTAPIFRTTASIVVSIVVVLALIVAIAFGAAVVDRWWRDRQAHNIRHGYEVQQTYRDEAERLIADWQSTPDTDTAHRGALAQRACIAADRIVGDVPPRIASFVSQEC
jgi:hypothetical protein